MCENNRARREKQIRMGGQSEIFFSPVFPPFPLHPRAKTEVFRGATLNRDLHAPSPSNAPTPLLSLFTDMTAADIVDAPLPAADEAQVAAEPTAEKPEVRVFSRFATSTRAFPTPARRRRGRVARRDASARTRVHAAASRVVDTPASTSAVHPPPPPRPSSRGPSPHSSFPFFKPARRRSRRRSVPVSSPSSAGPRGGYGRKARRAVIG